MCSERDACRNRSDRYTPGVSKYMTTRLMPSELTYASTHHHLCQGEGLTEAHMSRTCMSAAYVSKMFKVPNRASQGVLCVCVCAENSSNTYLFSVCSTARPAHPHSLTRQVSATETAGRSSHFAMMKAATSNSSSLPACIASSSSPWTPCRCDHVCIRT